MKRYLALGLVLTGMLVVSEAAFGAGDKARARAALTRTVPTINFTNITLGDAIDFLKDLSGVNLHVNWKAVEAAGVTKDTIVNMKLRQVQMQKVLRLLLNEASGGDTLTYFLDDGVIEITTTEVADAQMVTKIYPVQDLLFVPPTFEEPEDFDLNARMPRAGGQANGNVGNQANGMGMRVPKALDTNARSNELISVITETIRPSIWLMNGGKATIRIFNGSLIVTAPRSVQEALGGAID